MGRIRIEREDHDDKENNDSVNANDGQRGDACEDKGYDRGCFDATGNTNGDPMRSCSRPEAG